MLNTDAVIIGFVLITISSMGSVLWNLFAKNSLNKQVFLMLTISGSAATMVVANLVGISFGLIDFRFPDLFFPVVFIDGILLAGTFSCLAIAYKDGELSVVFPLWRLFALFVYFFGMIFHGENIGLISTIGIFLSVFGTYLMAVKNLEFRHLVQPIVALKSKVYMFAIAASVSTATSFILQKQMIPKSSPFVYNLFLQTFGGLFMLMANVFIFKINYTIVKDEWKKNWRFIVLVSWIGPGTLILTLFALLYIPASFAASFSQLGIVFGTITGIIFLRERENIPKKLISSTLIFIGVSIILIGS